MTDLPQSTPARRQDPLWVAARPRMSRPWFAPEPSRATAGLRIFASGLQILALTSYVVYFLNSEAPEPFSLADWVFMLVPPLAFGALLAVGFILGSVSSRWWRQWVRLGTVFGVVGLVATTLLLPLWLFGSFMDYTIG